MLSGLPAGCPASRQLQAIYTTAANFATKQVLLSRNPLRCIPLLIAQSEVES
jgi:hypothetical protein